MKTRWWVTACVTAVFAFTGMAAVAQGQKDKNRGQTKKRYREFNENQRRYATTYYTQNRDQEIFRPDSRWNNDYENRLRPGYVFDDDMRRMSRPAPYEMTRGFGPAPRGYRYVVIGGHVILIDDGYRVHDAIRFEINIGH